MIWIFFFFYIWNELMNWWGGPNQILLRAPKRLGPALQIGYGSLVFTPTKWTGHWGQAYWVWVPDVNVPSEGRQQSARQGAVCAERHDASTAIVTILHPESVFPWLTWTLLTLRHTKIHFCCIFSKKKKKGTGRNDSDVMDTFESFVYLCYNNQQRSIYSG